MLNNKKSFITNSNNKIINNQKHLKIELASEELVGVFHKNIGEGKPSSCVISCHGLLANKDSMKYITLGEMLSKRGLPVFRFDFRGCGESSGRLRDSHVTNRMKDLDTVIDFLTSKYNFKTFGLFGSSMGAFISYMKASNDPRIKVMISLASPYSMFDLFEKHKVDDEHFEVDGVIFGSEFVSDLKSNGTLSSDILNRIECPVYMFHGDYDWLVPVDHAHKIYKYLKTEKNLKIIEGGDHIFSNPFHLGRILKISTEWIQQYLNSTFGSDIHG
jgi:pimeloyl-ACP methyl ester carboxylesterase